MSKALLTTRPRHVLSVLRCKDQDCKRNQWLWKGSKGVIIGVSEVSWHPRQFGMGRDLVVYPPMTIEN